MGVNSPAAGMLDIEKSKTAYLIFNLNQAAGTYDLGTVTGADILVKRCLPYNAVAATGLTNVSIVTNDTAITTLLAVTLLIALTGGVGLALFNTPFVLPVGKKIRGTIVGNGTGGQINLAVEYRPLGAGALLA